MINPVIPRFGATLLGPVNQLPTGVAFSFTLSQDEIDQLGVAALRVKPDREISARLTQEMSPPPATSLWDKVWSWLTPKTLETTLTLSHVRGWVDDPHHTAHLLYPSQEGGNYKISSPLTVMRPVLKQLLATLPEVLQPYQKALQHAIGGNWQRPIYIAPLWGRVMHVGQSAGVFPPEPGRYANKDDMNSAQVAAFTQQVQSAPKQPYTFILPTQV